MINFFAIDKMLSPFFMTAVVKFSVSARVVAISADSLACSVLKLCKVFVCSVFSFWFVPTSAFKFLTAANCFLTESVRVSKVPAGYCVCIFLSVVSRVAYCFCRLYTCVTSAFFVIDFLPRSSTCFSTSAICFWADSVFAVISSIICAMY